MDLPHELALPLSSGVGFWYWLGGRPAFDFANTYRERWWRNVDTLVVPSDLCAWLCEAKLLEVPAAATRAHLQDARRLRAAIDAGILAAIQSMPPTAQTMNEINRWLLRTPPAEQLVRDRGAAVLRPRAPDDLIEQALYAIAYDAAIVLGTDRRARARVCASETCSARFFDASPAGTRRWCSMSACGNTAKARRHRTRVRRSEPN